MLRQLDFYYGNGEKMNEQNYIGDAPFRKALESVSTKVADGHLFMDVDTIPDINVGVASGVALAIRDGRGAISPDFCQGVVYMLQMLMDIHNGLLDLHAAELVPDTPDELTEGL